MTPPPRPVYLDLLKIHLPPSGWVSILHRVSGALLFLLFPLAVWALATALGSASGHARVAAWFDAGGVRLAVLVGVWALAHHFFAGLRHLALDLHLGLARERARQTSYLVLALAGAVTLVAAWRLV